MYKITREMYNSKNEGAVRLIYSREEEYHNA
jgi:hypothetical protein